MVNPTYKKGFFTSSPSAEAYLGDLKSDGTVQLAADWNVGAFDLTCVDMNATKLLVGTGSASAPSISFTGYTNTGWYYNTAGRIYGAVGGASILYAYSGGVTIESGKNLFLDGGRISAVVINNADSDTDEVDSYTWAGGYGMLIVSCSTDTAAAVYRLEGTTLTAISANAAFNTAKDNAATYNVYFEGGALKVQNKVGDNKAIKVGFYGL